MDRLPLMTNGKVDRAALPALTTAQPAIDTPYAPPRTPLEQEVAAIWAEVLGLPAVGIHDSFLDLGGHSLLATQIASRIGSRLGVDLPVSVLFHAATVAELTVVVTAVALAANTAEGSDPDGTQLMI
jgi:acyl carrier protein